MTTRSTTSSERTRSRAKTSYRALKFLRGHSGTLAPASVTHRAATRVGRLFAAGVVLGDELCPRNGSARANRNGRGCVGPFSYLCPRGQKGGGDEKAPQRDRHGRGFVRCGRWGRFGR